MNQDEIIKLATEKCSRREYGGYIFDSIEELEAYTKAVEEKKNAEFVKALCEINGVLDAEGRTNAVLLIEDKIDEYSKPVE